jgi:hypothetical protein
VAGFVDRYNCSWLIQRHGHHTQGGLPGSTIGISSMTGQTTNLPKSPVLFTSSVAFMVRVLTGFEPVAAAV